MNIKARIRPHYLIRWVLISCFCLAISPWFFYDGLVAYPDERECVLTYHEHLEEGGTAAQWHEIAREHGWPLDESKIPLEPKTPPEIFFQSVCGALAAVAAVACLISLARSRKRWVELTDEGIQTNRQSLIAFDQIDTINKSKWKSKGIAVLLYQSEGKQKKIVLDDWKFETEQTLAILREIETHLEDDQFVGGLPEPPPEEDSAEPASDASPDADPPEPQ